jgi:hypothetical protein
MRYMVITVLALMVATAAAGNVNEDINAPHIPAPPGNGPVWGGPDALVLWDNGPLITGDCPNNNPPGAESALTGTLFGYGHAITAGIRLADNFTVPAGEEWNVQAITFFAYQTGGGPGPSTINNVNLVVWDGAPGTGTIVCGDETTNLMILSAWAGIYRTNGACASDRAVMADIILPPSGCPECPGFPGSLRLGPGEYYMDWQTGGTLGSGPWMPPITPEGAGQPPNNNRDMQQEIGGIWGVVPDDGPFIIEGDFCGTTPVEAATWGQIKSTLR